MKNQLSTGEARRIALAAQGFLDRRPQKEAGRQHVMRAVRRTALVQIDSVNVAVRAHYMPPFSRLGAYDAAILDRANCSGRNRALFEYWAHEASLLPLEFWPLMRWRMEKAAALQDIYGRLAVFAREKADFVEAVHRRIAEEGPMAASDFDGVRGSGGWWGWSDVKHALEFLFWCGRLTTAARRANFERVYDLPERALPALVTAAPVPEPAAARRALVAIAGRALGIATASDLRDYFRLKPEEARPAIAELVEEGELLPVAVQGWRQPAYLARQARLPRRATAQALLAPFDPLIWERGRAERLFGFRYRIEIYTPAERRNHGYYVFPFLLQDRLVARVDLKADRREGRLLVQAAFAETQAPAETAEALAAELRRMADWLGLAGIAVQERGDLAATLAAACRKLS